MTNRRSFLKSILAMMGVAALPELPQSPPAAVGKFVIGVESVAGTPVDISCFNLQPIDELPTVTLNLQATSRDPEAIGKKYFAKPRIDGEKLPYPTYQAALNAVREHGGDIWVVPVFDEWQP